MQRLAGILARPRTRRMFAIVADPDSIVHLFLMACGGRRSQASRSDGVPFVDSASSVARQMANRAGAEPRRFAELAFLTTDLVGRRSDGSFS